MGTFSFKNHYMSGKYHNDDHLICMSHITREYVEMYLHPLNKTDDSLKYILNRNQLKYYIKIDKVSNFKWNIQLNILDNKLRPNSEYILAFPIEGHYLTFNSTEIQKELTIEMKDLVPADMRFIGMNIYVIAYEGESISNYLKDELNSSPRKSFVNLLAELNKIKSSEFEISQCSIMEKLTVNDESDSRFDKFYNFGVFDSNYEEFPKIFILIGLVGLLLVFLSIIAIIALIIYVKKFYKKQYEIINHPSFDRELRIRKVTPLKTIYEVSEDSSSGNESSN